MVTEPSSLLRRSQLEPDSQNPLNPMDFVGRSEHRPYVSVVVPAYNEASILKNNLEILSKYLDLIENKYRWELIIVNDGSTDSTGDLAKTFASARENICVIDHQTNYGLGQALKSGFDHCHGDYIVTLDIDLSYSPEHIEQLLFKIQETKAEIVLTSPYMKGGRVSHVPWLRLFLSVCANRFLSFATKGKFSTLTGMVRVYNASFLQTLNLKSTGMDINPEVIHKAMLLDARIEEIPAHLSWQPQEVTLGLRKMRRQSSMKLLRHTGKTFYYGLLFRPTMFFIIPSGVFFLLFLYSNISILFHAWTNYQQLAQNSDFPDPTVAFTSVFQQAPHTFMISGLMLILAIQLLSLGVLSALGKHYFEEIFYLDTAIYKATFKQEKT